LLCLLDHEIHTNHRCHGTSKAGVGEREQHASRNQQIANEVVLNPGGAEQQAEVARLGIELIELSCLASESSKTGAPGAGRSRKSRKRIRLIVFERRATEIEVSGSAQCAADDVAHDGEPLGGCELAASRIVDLIGERGGSESGKSASHPSSGHRVPDIQMLTEPAPFTRCDQQNLSLDAAGYDAPFGVSSECSLRPVDVAETVELNHTTLTCGGL
jgi:hypothetical protein